MFLFHVLWCLKWPLGVVVKPSSEIRNDYIIWQLLKSLPLKELGHDMSPFFQNLLFLILMSRIINKDVLNALLKF